MSNKNYKFLLLKKIEEFSRDFPDYQVWDIIFSGLREHLKDLKEITKNDLLVLTDEEIYNCLCKTYNRELLINKTSDNE